jgi:hypothetical protein
VASNLFDLYQRADALLKQYGGDAVAHARRQAILSRGDMEQRETWLQIVAVIQDMMSIKSSPPSNPIN